MEILGMKIPGLEDAVFSGLESVTSGIKESAKASGIFTLGIAAESFSFSESTSASGADFPSVGDAATYPGPADYFRGFESDAATLFPLPDIPNTLNTPGFRAERSLDDWIGDMVGYQDLAMLIHEKIKELGEILGAVSLDQARGNRSIEGGSVAGSSDGASSRSIIVVGGKSPDTFYLTLDDSLQQMQQAPSPETAQLYQNQVGAVQNMVSTVDQVVQMQKNIASSMLFGGLRI